MNTKSFIYIAIVAVLLIAWNYRASIENSIARNVKDVREASPFTDDRIEGEIDNALGR
jgi:hypothetical protein